MTAEKHAEAAAEEIASWLRKEAHLFPSDGNIAEWAKLIGHHSQSAIDKATAPLKARIAKLEGLGPLIERAMALAFQQGAGVLGKSCSDVKKQIDSILKGES
jgi:hypothetical protein